MTLADSSVWIDHLRHSDARLKSLLGQKQLVLHPMVMGELALGSMKDRSRLLHDLDLLPSVASARDIEVRTMIERRHLYSRGIGYVDAHLLAAAVLTPGIQLWTRDHRLRVVADEAGVLAPFA